MYLYNKPCLHHDMAYINYMDLVKKNRVLSLKVLRDKAFEIASDPRYGSSGRGLASKSFLIKNLAVLVLNLYQINSLHTSFIK